jgi:hypothetical protein
MTYKGPSLQQGWKQIAEFADVDILVMMHGSGSHHIATLPPRALVIELEPQGETYCIVSACFPHDEMIFIKAETQSRANWPEMWCRAHGHGLCGAHVPTQEFISALDTAWETDVYRAYDLHLNTKHCAPKQTPLKRWMRQGLSSGYQDTWCVKKRRGKFQPESIDSA